MLNRLLRWLFGCDHRWIPAAPSTVLGIEGAPRRRCLGCGEVEILDIRDGTWWPVAEVHANE